MVNGELTDAGEVGDLVADNQCVSRAPWLWQAYAHLGAMRDFMDPAEVRVVQSFLDKCSDG